MRLTHWQYLASTQQLNAPVKCSASHGTYGGRCLNCGYDPSKDYSISFVVDSAVLDTAK
jgi:hypothetical protein